MASKIKSKFGIRTRVFLSFGFFIILVTNIFSLTMYIFVERSFIDNIKDIISTEFINTKNIIDNSNSLIITISPQEEERLKSLGIFYYIGNNNNQIIENYKLGYYMYGDNIIFRGDYKGYNIVIGKNISDLYRFKKNLIDTSILLNIFGLFITFTISYFVTNRVLKPLIKLSKYISNYEITEDKTFIINKYGSSEIGLITESLNKFISDVRDTIESQKFFIQDASHELKTPLMQIESNIELLELEVQDPKILKRLDNIKISVDNINMVVSNLGFLVRGKEKIVNKEKIDIYKYLKDLSDNFEVEARRKNIKIEIIEENNFVLENSVYYLDRLFGNLISNAIAYNDGNNTIKIIIDNKKVIIEDKGIGISEEELKRIFNRFYRNKNSDLYNNAGSGLGLTIVKTITDSFAWGIEIDSELGKFTRITLTFK